jgi:hypothetical protein
MGRVYLARSQREVCDSHGGGLYVSVSRNVGADIKQNLAIDLENIR